MFLPATVRKKDGKEHTYYSVVENMRVADGRVVQRHVLYRGEINSSQQLAWRKSIEVLDEKHRQSARTIALFPEQRCEALGEEQGCGAPTAVAAALGAAAAGLGQLGPRDPVTLEHALTRRL